MITCVEINFRDSFVPTPNSISSEIVTTWYSNQYLHQANVEYIHGVTGCDMISGKLLFTNRDEGHIRVKLIINQVVRQVLSG